MHRLPLTQLASAILLVFLLPSVTHAQTVINNDNLTDTFGSPTETGRLINKGSITVNRNGAIGMQGGTDTYLSNQSAITVTGPNATGMEGRDGAILENILNGSITVNQSNGKGMSVTGNGGILTNNTRIVTNGDNSTGIFVNDTGDDLKNFYIYNGESFSPNATIHLAGDNSTGIDMTGNHATIFNYGTIRADGTASTGIRVTGDNPVVVNEKTAYIYLAGSNSNGITSSGNNASITHAGNIISEGDNSNGIATTGSSANITNTGSIVMTGANSNGIFVNSSNTSVSSTGFIIAGQGHQLAVGSSGSATVNQWGTAVAPTKWQTSPNLRPFGVAAGGTLVLNETALTFRPGNASDGFQFDTTYPVASLIDNQGTVTGAIGSVPKGALPMVDVYLHSTAAPGDPVSWDNQYFSLHVDPDKGPGQQSNQNVIRATQNRVWLANQIIGATLDNASDWHAFIQPYYLDAHASGSSGSDSNSTGLIFGGTRQIAKNWRIGAHAGIEHTNLSARNFGLDGDSTSWLFGVHTYISLPKNTFIRGQLTGMVSQSRYDFSMVGDTASDKRKEYGAFANMTGGVDLKASPHHTFTPEIGLAYLWIKNPSMDVQWRYPDNTDLNMHFESAKYHAIFGTAALRYTGNWTTSQGEFSPMLALGLRQTLSSADITSDMTFMGQRYHGSTHEDKTVTTIEAGLKLTRGRTSSAIRYSGNFGNTISDHIVWAEFGFVF